MTGITYQVWRICGIVFILLLPYVVLRRRLWFPGLAVIGLGVFGSIKFWPALGGEMRVWDLLMIGGVFTVLLILIDKKKFPESRRMKFGSLENAPIFLMALLFLLLFRIVCEYVYTGELFLQRVIRDLLVSTLLPCTIILIHPSRKDAFQEILKGIGIGAFLALLPAFTDLETFRHVWTELSSGHVLGHYGTNYWGKMPAEWAVQLVIVLLYLGNFKAAKKKYYYSGAVILCIFSVIPLSRRWFVGLILFLALYYFWGLKRENQYFGKWHRRPNKALSVLIVCLGVCSVYFVQSRFERHNVRVILAELGPSSRVIASASRKDYWDFVLNDYRRQPLIGVGFTGSGSWMYEIEPGTGEILSQSVGAHNLFLDLLVKTGALGALLGIVFLKRMFFLLKKWLRLTRANEHFYKELSFISIYWISIFSAAITGGEHIENLGLIAILPCAVRLVIKSHLESAGSNV